ncbi:unnamed protein product [Pleuronectes platessa]|uniref:Uncharacterized protein n=1 Tax=Pleuronectes platessa TaxID=8262 RepID=A0A9N7YMA7_PLEPL|nr:unnamed protein product [Pleuronectes platessa]
MWLWSLPFAFPRFVSPQRQLTVTRLPSSGQIQRLCPEHAHTAAAETVKQQLLLLFITGSDKHGERLRDIREHPVDAVW